MSFYFKCIQYYSGYYIQFYTDSTNFNIIPSMSIIIYFNQFVSNHFFLNKINNFKKLPDLLLGGRGAHKY